MAETFAFNVQAPVQQAGPLGPVAAQVGAAGNQYAPSVSQPGGVEADNSGAKTLAALEKMGQSLLAPHVAAEKQRMMMEGLVAGLQGISASQIKDDELLGMFGDSITVGAARQVEKMDAVNKFSTTLASQMPELRQMDPNSFRTWLPEQLKQYSTGDAQSDALITEAFVERLPQTIDMHTKAHIGYRQEVAENAWSNDLNTSGSALAGDMQAARTMGLSPDNVVRSQQQFVSRLAGPGGINSAVYPKWLNKAYRRFASEGNLQALTAIEQSGVLEATQTDAEFAELLKQRDRAEGQAIVRNAELVTLAGDRGGMEALIDLGGSGFANVGEAVAWARKVDEEAMATYGGSKPIYGEPGYARIAESFVKGLHAAKERLARDGGSKDGLGAMQQHIGHLMAKRGFMSKGLANMDGKTLRSAQDWVYTNLPFDKAIEFAAADGDTWPVIQNELQAFSLLLDSGEHSPELGRSMAVASKMVQEAGASGLQLMGKYFGDKAPNAMLFLQLAAGVEKPEELAEVIRQNKPWLNKPATNLDMAGVSDHIRNELGKGVGNSILSAIGFGGSMEHLRLSDQGEQLLVDMITPLAGRAQMGSARSVEAATNIALGQMKGMVDFAMGIPVTGNQLVADPSVRSFSAALNAKIPKGPDGNKVAIDPYGENYQRAMQAVIKEKLKAFEGHDSFFSPPEALYGTWTGSVMQLGVLVRGGEQSIVVTPDEVLAALKMVQAAKDTQGNIDINSVRNPLWGVNPDLM